MKRVMLLPSPAHLSFSPDSQELGLWRGGCGAACSLPPPPLFPQSCGTKAGGEKQEDMMTKSFKNLMWIFQILPPTNT